MPEAVEVRPVDEHNQILVNNVHPPDWKNPEPAPRYHLVVIGAGSAGLITALGAAGIGAKVALIEKHLLGGDCLNYGCVPSKGVIRAARAVADARESQQFGLRLNGSVECDFAAAMERMRRLRAKISHHDSAKRVSDLGVDVFLGQAEFVSRNTIEVGGKRLNFKRAVIASGASPVVPAVPGLAEAGFLTNETVFSLTERPNRLLVIGAGPIGCELSQAFLRLGSKVTLVENAPQFLTREDRDAAEILHKRFAAEGMDVRVNTKLLRVEKTGAAKRAYLSQDGKESTLEADQILVGVGRAPNVKGLDLEAAGVQYDDHQGVIVNDHLQTTNPAIFAAGDICLKFKFTHTADATARMVIQNALFPFLPKKKLSSLVIPWCTYTDPEIAHVGMYEKDAREKGIEVDTFIRHFDDVDRAILDGEDEGFVKIHVKRGTGRILGATIVARHAGEMISELTAAIVGGVGLKSLSGVIHPYPTQAEAIRQVADRFNASRLTDRVKKIFALWFRFFR
ncbi:MAG: mercuric reductase [bacterium]